MSLANYICVYHPYLFSAKEMSRQYPNKYITSILNQLSVKLKATEQFTNMFLYIFLVNFPIK